MTTYNHLISCLSWEDRFIGSIKYHIENSKLENLEVLAIDEFNEKTKTYALEYEKLVSNNQFQESKIEYISIDDDIKAWNSIHSFITDRKIANKHVMLDISTMPRFMIWFLAHFLLKYNNKIDYCYFSPEEYPEANWLTDDPLMPRLIFKHSGIFLPNKKTVLIIQSGFDIERTAKLINTFEPEKVLIGIQEGEQYCNTNQNKKRHKENLQYQEIEYFTIDAFDNPHGFIEIEEQVKKYVDNKNIIMTSFGPKITSMEMFKINLAFPQTALAYVPVRAYNDVYSSGIDIKNPHIGSIT